MLNAWEIKASEPEVVATVIRLLGTGASDCTKEIGAGVTVARTGAGAHTITWADDPGVFLGWSASFGAATPGDMAGHTAIRDTYASKALPFVVYDSSFAADDLEADEYIDIVVWFRRTSVAGA